MTWTSTPVYVGANGVVDQIDLDHNFYFDFLVYADPYKLLPPQTTWAAATPGAVKYAPFQQPQMPPVGE